MKGLVFAILIAVVMFLGFRAYAQQFTVLDQRDGLNVSIADSQQQITKDNAAISAQQEKITGWNFLITQAQQLINGYQEDIAKKEYTIGLAQFSLNAIANDVTQYEEYLANQANQQNNNSIIP